MRTSLYCILLVSVLAGAAYAGSARLVHVIVPLCDNKHQGIVPVSATLGNGQDANSNLYWGAMYGVRTFFNRSGHWQKLACEAPAHVLARVAYRLVADSTPVYLIADAYDGAKMSDALRDFLQLAAGRQQSTARIRQGTQTTDFQGADLVCFAGHNGLMDERIAPLPQGTDGQKPEHAVVLACISGRYFSTPLRAARCEPLITTTGLMAPEAYTLDAILRAWAAGETPERIRERAAAAYAKYQKCSLNAAHRLFATGWPHD